MARIRDLINQKKGIARTASAAFSCQKAEKIIKELIGSNNLRVAKYQNQTLFLKIKTPSLAQKIFNRQTEIKKQLQEKLKRPVERLSFFVGDLH